MKKILEDILLTGLGTIVLTKEKAQKLIDKMIEQGDLSKKEGRELLDEFLQKTDEETSKISDRISSELKNRLKQAGFVTEEDLKKVNQRIDLLEEKLEDKKETDLKEQDEEE